MIAGLAFTPPTHLNEAVKVLANLVFANHSVLEWFEDEMFIQDCWKISLEPTNAEAVHRRIKTESSVDHPVLWIFIDTIKKYCVERT